MVSACGILSLSAGPPEGTPAASRFSVGSTFALTCRAGVNGSAALTAAAAAADSSAATSSNVFPSVAALVANAMLCGDIDRVNAAENGAAKTGSCLYCSCSSFHI